MMAEGFDQTIPGIADLVGFDLCDPLGPRLENFPKTFVYTKGLEFWRHHEIMSSVGADLFQIKSQEIILARRKAEFATCDDLLLFFEVTDEVGDSVQSLHDRL